MCCRCFACRVHKGNMKTMMIMMTRGSSSGSVCSGVHVWVLVLLWLCVAIAGQDNAQGNTLQIRQLSNLTVRRGRSAYLQPRDLIITLPATSQFSEPDSPTAGINEPDLSLAGDTRTHVTQTHTPRAGHVSHVDKPATSCIVQVVDDDPVTQRVGSLEPKVFSCDVPSYTVKYTHSGSPLLNQDHVLLLVHHFSDSATITGSVYLTVDVVDAAYEVVIQESRLQSLRVPEFFGYTNTIDPSVLQFRYNYYNGAMCTISLNNDSSHWPKLGSLVTLDSDDEVGHVTHDCRDFLYLGLRYKHTSPPTPNMDYVPLTVKLVDHMLSPDPIVENVFLPIIITGAYPNLAPTASVLENYVMQVEQYSLRTVSYEALSAKDSETPAEELVFNITTPLPPHHGYFVHRDKPTKEIRSFLQADLINRNIAFQAPSYDLQSHLDTSVELVAYDSHYVGSEPVVFRISIRPSRTSSPRVAVSRGLMVMEGESRPITTGNIITVSSDVTTNATVHVKAGLRHGHLTVNGRTAEDFTASDVQSRAVVYHHDDSDALEDRIFFRVTNGKLTTRVKIPIEVIPKDDDAPSLLVNEGLDVQQGDFVQITDETLSAHDKDSQDQHVVYVLKTVPTRGEIRMKNSPYIPGQQVSTFTQQDIRDGLVYYQHFAENGAEDDMFEVKVMDEHEPPNKSSKYTVVVQVSEREDAPPVPAPDSSPHLLAHETDVVTLSGDQLTYTDVESGDNDITYVITSQPFFLTTTITIDAGKLVRIPDNVTQLTYSTRVQLPAVHRFTQSEVTSGRIAYVPPGEDIGPIRRHARFIYAVIDGAGNKVLNKFFDITLLPVNNRIPHMIVNEINVPEGGSAMLSTNEITAYDPDTDQTSLVFVLETLPGHGSLWNNNQEMSVGSQFTLMNLMEPTIRYENDGAEQTVDQFSLSITDGTNTATKIIPISILLVNDNAPEIMPGLSTQLEVEERGEVVLTADNLAATDHDSDDNTLRFVVIRSPQYGELHVEGHNSAGFTQADIRRGVVHYVHTSGEIGIDPVPDSATFAVQDQATMSFDVNGPLIDLNITVLPVDNTHPYIVLGGPLFVNEGGEAMVGTNVLAAHDMDTPMGGLRFVVTKQPDWGALVNTRRTTPSSSTRDDVRLVGDFTLLDITDNVIRYEQNNHTGIEPLSDSFEVYVTDGGRRSHPSMVQISIVPQNDELPRLIAANLTVDEGHRKVITDLQVHDVDLPSENLRISVRQLPAYGRLTVIQGDVDTGREAPLPQYIDTDDLGTSVHLVYTHDSSENFDDSFTLEVSDGFQVTNQRVHVKVQPSNDEVPEIITNAGTSVIFGDVSLISTVVLEARDLDSTEHDLYYILLTQPQQGHLQYKYGDYPEMNDYDLMDANWINLHLLDNFTQHDINTNHVRYIHTGSGSTEESSDSFVFHVSDGRYHTLKQTFHITIINTKTIDITITSEPVNIREGGTKVITSDHLLATEGFTEPGDLVFYITGPPSHGYLSLAGSNMRSVQSFTQRDVLANKLIYTHDVYSSSDVRPGGAGDGGGALQLPSTVTNDRFYYTVVSVGGNSNRTRSGVLQIHVEPMDRILPTLDTLMPLTVVQSYEELLSSANLHVSDPDTPTFNLTYIITDPPVHGTLLNAGVPVGDEGFTQYDLDQERISYRSNTSDDVGIDFFLFTITDQKHTGYLINGSYHNAASFFSILIQPLTKELPRLQNNAPPGELEYFGKGKHGYTFTRQNLLATQPLSENSEIVYILLVRPEHGILYNKVTKRGVKKRFTQYDIDKEHLVYMLYEETTASNDSLVFRVQDKYRNTLDNQRLDLSWSVMEVDRTTYVVCEDAGNVVVGITRSGCTDGVSTVELHAKGLTAREGQDYLANQVTTIRFQPGVRSMPWSVDILRDSIKEKDEKLRLTLRAPTNAILGRNEKATLNIINYNNGRCADYIGMISSTDPQITALDHQQNSVIKQPLYGESSSSHLQHVYGAAYRDQAHPPLHDQAPGAGADDSTADTHHRELPRTQQEWDDLLLGNGHSPAALPTANRYRQTSQQEVTSHNTPTDWNGNRRNRKHRGKVGKGKRSKRPVNTIDVSVETTADDTDTESGSRQVAPKTCDRETKGLLYYDLKSSVMYRCDGHVWSVWDRADGHVMFQTAPVASGNGAAGEQAGGDGDGASDAGGSLHGTATKDLMLDSPSRKECAQGWSKFHDYCYKPIVSKETWVGAERRCVEVYEANLAHIASARHQDWMWQLADRQPFWIGLNDRLEHHRWEYTAEAPARFFNWRRGFPTNQRSMSKNCVLVSRDMEWVNRPCTKNAARYVCMKPARVYNQNKKRRRRNHL